MRPFAFIWILIVGVSFSLTAQENTSVTEISPKRTDLDLAKLAQVIDKDDLKKNLSILASDEYEGRETGTPGQVKSANYIAEQISSYGIKPLAETENYQQNITFITETWRVIKLKLNGESRRHLWDFYAYPSTNSDQIDIKLDEIIFLGYGIESESYNDYKNADVSGKAILIFDGEPVSKKGKSQVTGTDSLSVWSTDWRKKLEVAKAKGVEAVFIIDRAFQKNIPTVRKTVLNKALRIGTGENAKERFPSNFFLTSTMAKEIFGKKYKKILKARKRMNKRGKSRDIKIECDIQFTQQKKVRSLDGSNVLAFVEGTDPELKEEVIVVSAHYDHLGKRGTAIYYGADDNGSGTVTVLEICQAFSEAKAAGHGPKRSVLFLWVSGEEKGLLGSDYYSEFPIIPLENTIANLNIDMIGRVDKKHADNPDYVYLIGSDRISTDLHLLSEAMNEKYTQFDLDYTYNDENDPNRYYYRSDHYNFAKRGIPVIFYFSGVHQDYHRTSDTVDKINFERMEKIGRMVFYTAWELANQKMTIRRDVPQTTP